MMLCDEFGNAVKYPGAVTYRGGNLLRDGIGVLYAAGAGLPAGGGAD